MSWSAAGRARLKARGHYAVAKPPRRACLRHSLCALRAMNGAPDMLLCLVSRGRL